MPISAAASMTVLAFGRSDFLAVDSELNRIHKNPKIGVLEYGSVVL